MIDFGFLGADSFRVDPKIVEAAKNAQKGEWTAAGAGAGAALCAATGVGAAAAPICAAVGGWLGQKFAAAFNGVKAGYEEQKAQLAAQDAAAHYLDSLKQLRDEYAEKTVRELVTFGKQNGWPQANQADVAVALSQLGANITNVPVDARTNALPSGVLISTATLARGGPYMSGPLPCSGSMPHVFLVCKGGSGTACKGGQFVVNQGYMQCMTDQTNKWAGQMEVAATYLGAAILDRKAPGQINFNAPMFSMKSSSGLSTTTKVIGGAAALGGGWWLLTKLGWL